MEYRSSTRFSGIDSGMAVFQPNRGVLNLKIFGTRRNCLVFDGHGCTGLDTGKEMGLRHRFQKGMRREKTWHEKSCKSLVASAIERADIVKSYGVIFENFNPPFLHLKYTSPDDLNF